MGKDQLERQGKLPTSLKVDQELINIANEIIAKVDEFFPRFNKAKRKRRLEILHPDQRPVEFATENEQRACDAVMDNI